MPLHCSKQAETSERPRRDHQKGSHNRNLRHCGPRGSRPQGYTLATGVNTIETSARNDRGRDLPARQKDRNMSRTTCYNGNKKGHFANKFPEPRKPKN